MRASWPRRASRRRGRAIFDDAATAGQRQPLAQQDYRIANGDQSELKDEDAIALKTPDRPGVLFAVLSGNFTHAGYGMSQRSRSTTRRRPCGYRGATTLEDIAQHD